MKRKNKNIMRCIISFVMTVSMVLGAVPLPFMPASMVVYADGKELSGSESYTANDGDVLTGSTRGTVTIADGASITLSDVTITGGIVCEGTATITLAGTNIVNVNDAIPMFSKAGIQIGSSGTTLTIKGDGSLTATGGSAAAGIGLGRTWDASVTAGAIVIEGGTVTASGGNGIGTGTVGNEKTASIDGISIKGGTVNASLGKGDIYNGSTAIIGYIKIYDTIDMVDASKITETVTYMHGETDVTANASNYFTITEDGDRRIIAPKDDTDYTITIADDIEHGTLTGAATAKYMENVTITATPDFGYRLSRLVVKDAQNNNVESTGNSFFMPKSNVTVSAVFEQGTHGTTEFEWLYRTGPELEDIVLETIYDGVTTVNIQNREMSYNIRKYEGNTYYQFLLDNDTYDANIPYAGGTGEFYKFGNPTYFVVPYDGETGFYDITMNDAGGGKWSVSILKTVAVMDAVPDQTYTGSAITPEPQVMAGSLSLTKGTDYEYSYMDNTNVGTAKVTVTFKGDYASLGSVEKEFTIVSHIHSFDYSVEGATITATCSAADCTLTDNKTTLTINAPTLATYGGTGSAESTLDGLDAFKAATGLNISETDIKYVGRGSTSYGESSTAPTDAGTYTASITAGSKTASVDYTIAPKSISISGATATERGYEKDSTSVEISAVTFDGATLTKGTDYTVTGAMEDDTAGDSKSVTVTVTLTNGNYTFGTNGNTKTTTVKINKIDHDGVTSSGSAKYGREGTVDLSSLIEAGGSLGEVSVSDTNNVLDGTPTIETDGKTLKFKFSNNSDNVGKTATVTIPVEGATNYKDYNIVVTLTVAEKIVPTLAVSDYTKTYDGNSVTISDLTKSAKDGSLNVDGTWDFEGTPGLKNVSDSGTITVRFTPTDTASYESATATFMLTINRKSVTVKADNKNMVVSTTPEPELTATVSGTVGNDTVIYSLDREAGTVVGDYVITPSGDTLQGNYTVSYETGTFTITEYTTAPVVKKAPKAITGLVYNGTAQALVEPGEAENGTMYYAVATENTAPADNLYTTSIPAKTEAGTYYVWYKVVGDKNHKYTEPACVKVTIAEQEKKSEDPKSEESDSEDQEIKLKSVSLSENISIKTGETLQLVVTFTPADASDKTVEWKSSDTDIATVDASGNVKGVKAGYAVVSATAKDGGYTASCKVEVNPAHTDDNAETTWISDEDLKEYKIPEEKKPEYTAESIKIGSKNDSKEVKVSISMNYMDAVTYNGKALTPKTSDEFKFELKLDDILTQAGVSGVKAEEIFKVSFVGKSKDAGEGTFYAKVSLVPKAKSKFKLTKQQEKDLKKIISAVNKVLKNKDNRVKFKINKASIAGLTDLQVKTKLTKDGKLKLDKKDKLTGIKSVKYKKTPADAKYTTLSKKAGYSVEAVDINTLKVIVKGTKNYTGWTTVTASK